MWTKRPGTCVLWHFLKASAFWGHEVNNHFPNELTRERISQYVATHPGDKAVPVLCKLLPAAVTMSLLKPLQPPTGKAVSSQLHVAHVETVAGRGRSLSKATQKDLFPGTVPSRLPAGGPHACVWAQESGWRVCIKEWAKQEVIFTFKTACGTWKWSLSRSWAWTACA